MKQGTDLRYVHQDHLTGTALVTSDNGTSLGLMKYYPYGDTRSGSVPTDKKFTGQRLDSTGLYYYNARYYDPQIGRFISADTVVPNPANPQAFNRYSYCLNNPLKYVDPSGHIVQFQRMNPYVAYMKYCYGNYNIDPYAMQMVYDMPDPEARSAWGALLKEGDLKARRIERSKTVYNIQIELNNSTGSWESMYITNMNSGSVQRYEWHPHVIYFPFREGNKWEGQWYEDYSYGKEPIDWNKIGQRFADVDWEGLGRATAGSLGIVGGSFIIVGGEIMVLTGNEFGTTVIGIGWKIIDLSVQWISEGKSKMPEFPW